MKESIPHSFGDSLPPELAEFLKSQETACLMIETNYGTAFIIKLPRAEMAHLSGPVPIGVRHFMYPHPLAPVIRTELTIHDDPDYPLQLDTYINIADPEQRADYARLSQQQEALLIFYDEGMRNDLIKRVPGIGNGASRVLRAAAEHLSRIPPAEFDYDKAKEEVVRDVGV